MDAIKNVIMRERYQNNNIAIRAHPSSHLHFLCLKRIFEYLPIKDRVRSERVCKAWLEAGKSSWINMKHLNFSPALWGDNKDITMDMLKEVVRRCGKHIEHLTVVNRMFMEGEGCNTEFLRTLPKLKSVDFTSIRVSKSELDFLTKYYDNLMEFSFGRTTRDIKDHDFGNDVFKKYTNLRTLKLERTNVVTGSCLEFLSPESIENLSLINCKNLGPSILSQNLSKYRRLRTLSLSQSIRNPFDFTCLKSSILTELDVSYNDVHVNDQSLKEISRHCRSLKSLNLSGCCKLTDEGLKVLEAFEDLEYLYIACMCQATDKMLEKVPVKNLKTLDARSCNFTDKALIEFLGKAKKLELLDCTWCQNLTEKFVEAAIGLVYSRATTVELKIVLAMTNIEAPYVANRLSLLKFEF